MYLAITTMKRNYQVMCISFLLTEGKTDNYLKLEAPIMVAKFSKNKYHQKTEEIPERIQVMK